MILHHTEQVQDIPDQIHVSGQKTTVSADVEDFQFQTSCESHDSLKLIHNGRRSFNLEFGKHVELRFCVVRCLIRSERWSWLNRVL